MRTPLANMHPMVAIISAILATTLSANAISAAINFFKPVPPPPPPPPHVISSWLPQLPTIMRNIVVIASVVATLSFFVFVCLNLIAKCILRFYVQRQAAFAAKIASQPTALEGDLDEELRATPTEAACTSDDEAEVFLGKAVPAPAPVRPAKSMPAPRPKRAKRAVKMRAIDEQHAPLTRAATAAVKK